MFNFLNCKSFYWLRLKILLYNFNSYKCYMLIQISHKIVVYILAFNGEFIILFNNYSMHAFN